MFRKLLQDHPEIANALRSRLARHVVQVAEEFQVVGARLKELDASLR
jgi:hypothetical protein